jgi:DNA-binding XRE family transcriptional regulator
MKAASNWDKYLKAQLKNPAVKRGFDDEMKMLKLGLRLAEQRQRQGLTQAEVAKRIGTSAPQLCRTERRPERANMSTLIKYADALGMGLDVKLVAKR